MPSITITITRSLLVMLGITFFVLPMFTSAHTSGNESSNEAMVPMMQIGDMMMGEENHEEMETLMEDMMANELSEKEQQEFHSMTEQYPGAGAMMMHRMSRYPMSSVDSLGMANEGSKYVGHINRMHQSPFTVVWWVMGILSFIFLVLANIALIKWIKKN